MTLMTLSHKSQRLLIKCFLFSLVIHVAAVAFFYFSPFLLQGPFKSLFAVTISPVSLLESNIDRSEANEKNRMLQEVFDHVLVLSPHLQQPYDLVELPKEISLAPNEEETKDLIPQDTSLSYPTKPKREFTFVENTPIQNSEEDPSFNLFLPKEIDAPIISQLQIDANLAISEIPLISVPTEPTTDDDFIAVSDFSLLASHETEDCVNVPSPLVSSNHLKIDEDFQLKNEMKSQITPATLEELNLDREKVRSTLFIPKTARPSIEKKELRIASSLEDLEQYDFPKMAMTSEWNAEFDVDVSFLPNPKGEGYIFSLSLQPNFDFSNHSLRQNLYFILDRSNSIQKHRFAVFKRAVLKALASMQKGDTFNIFVVDKKLNAFNSKNLPVTLKNIRAAEEFLDKQEAGGLFSAGEIYKSLEKLLPLIPENEEFHTAILLTDGTSSLNHERKQSTFKKWVEKNHGKLALYAAAVGQNNDLLTLDMLCSISGGRLLYSDTHASFPRKLAKLVLDLKDPLAKDLIITAIPRNPNSHVEFYPAGTHLPALYSHQPYVLIGQIDDPCAFDLVIQGRHRDEWVAIKKHISFVEGQKGSHALEMKWSAQHANICYAKFLEEGKPAHLKEAKEILKKSRREIAFE